MTREELLKLCDYLECNDASMEAQREAAAFIRKTLAQPEQEPVAVARVDDLERGGRVRALAMNLSLDAPLYTTPPQRKPLTFDQIAEATQNIGLTFPLARWRIARAIEAAHGIKGEA